MRGGEEKLTCEPRPLIALRPLSSPFSVTSSPPFQRDDVLMMLPSPAPPLSLMYPPSPPPPPPA